MTAKKRWLKKIYHDSQETLPSTQGHNNISWSSTESDCEEQVQCKKRKKSKTKNAGVWIEPKVRINKREVYEDSYFITPTDSNSNRSPSASRNMETSPLINSLNLREASPVLTETSNRIEGSDEVSPIIGKRGILKNIRSRCKITIKQQLINEESDSSPEIFKTQSSRIIDSESPDFFAEASLSQATERIDPFPSQSSSQIVISDSSTKTDNNALYHQPLSRKKHYKKRGLASLLQKSLQLQRTRYSIWKHEIYTKKFNSFMNLYDEDIIEFVVKTERKEYGNTLLECETPDDLLPSTSVKKNNCFLIIIGCGVPNSFEKNCRYKLFPPYSTKTIMYKSEKITCYFNVSKIL